MPLLNQAKPDAQSKTSSMKVCRPQGRELGTFARFFLAELVDKQTRITFEIGME